jgi:putative nucleotidyltransferase with HDIG domain
MLIHKHSIEDEVFEMFSSIIEKKDTYTAGHSRRVAYFSSSIAKRLHLSEEDQKIAFHAGLLHDIGKLFTPESILLKPRRLTKKEFTIIQKHSEDGDKILSYLSSFKQYGSIIRHHHEYYDGNGYPDKLCGEDIPLLSRIISIADAFDAMTTNRIYKCRKTTHESIKELKKWSGKQFDPKIIEVAIEFFQSYQESSHVNRMPYSFIEEERLAFFYKDTIASVYTSEYLNYFLQGNVEMNKFESSCLIQIHTMTEYNREFGWKSGNNLIREIAIRLKILFQTHYIFRVFGDDFIILNTQHITLDAELLNEKISTGFNQINISVIYFPLKDFAFNRWEDYEPYLQNYKRK